MVVQTHTRTSKRTENCCTWRNQIQTSTIFTACFFSLLCHATKEANRFYEVGMTRPKYEQGEGYADHVRHCLHCYFRDASMFSDKQISFDLHSSALLPHCLALSTMAAKLCLSRDLMRNNIFEYIIMYVCFGFSVESSNLLTSPVFMFTSSYKHATCARTVRPLVTAPFRRWQIYEFDRYRPWDLSYNMAYMYNYSQHLIERDTYFG